MAYLKQQQNYNGTGVVSRILIVYFKNSKVIMTQFQSVTQIAAIAAI
jgi:hypothetical protein